MGTPMALNLSKRFPVAVWNRSPSKYPSLQATGCHIAQKPSEVVRHCSITFMMLFDAPAIQSIFDEDMRRSLRGRTIVNTSSVPVDFSHYIAAQVHECGGSFIEMPVSGSRIPAEQGQLIGLMAGEAGVAEYVKPFTEPLTKTTVYCGPIGAGLQMKYATNTYLTIMTAGLAEAMNLAEAQGLDIATFGRVLDEGPLASDYSKIKVAKILKGDWSPQGSVQDCYNSTQLIKSASQITGTRSPMIERCSELYKEAVQRGLGKQDMIAVTKIFSKNDSTHLD
ncbi:Nad-binding protein [Apiospora saccharicola]|uniref:Nad-binding protein n=1 Tax=Apiospora saccharicola TaxID=335842 RepID=A0ABR1THJ7_9PEZI